VRCGRFVDGGSRHHRQLRRSGDHTPANLILLCGSGTTGCHGWVHANPRLSLEHGWIVNSWNTPASVPLFYRRRWVLLNTEGHIMTTTPDAARERLIELGVLT
jgi:hypothetical protein